MTDNTSGIPGEPRPEPAEYSGAPAESGAESGAPESPPAAEPHVEPSPWAPQGYQDYQNYQYQPAEPVADQQRVPPTAGQPTGEVPVGEPFAGGYPHTGGQPTAEYPPTGYPPMGGPATAGLPVAGAVPRPSRGRGLLVGVTVLALVVGGLAGSLGGYLVAQNNGSGNPVTNALNSQAPSQPVSNAPAGSVQAVAQRVLPSVVEIAVTFAQPQQGADGDTGSGVIISSDGNILTNNHVVAGAANGAGNIQVVFSNGKMASASIVGRDPTTDVAVIKAQGVSGLPTASLGNSDNLATGQQVIAIGAPYQLAGTVTEGIISSLHRPVAAGEGGGSTTQATVLDAIQTDAAINPGNSGGALVDMSGAIVGINSAIYSPSQSDSSSSSGNVGIGFAIPINQAVRIAKQITTTGQATQTVLGVKVADSVPASAGGGQQQQNPQAAACESGAIVTNGALIVSVTGGGPADKAGLKAGDVVVAANGRQINSCDGLVAAVHAAAPGDQLKLTLSNGNTVTATLSGEPVKPNG